MKFFKLVSIFQKLVVFTFLYKQGDGQLEEKFIKDSTKNGCVCPGDILTYECTVFGDSGGITVWMGDFFHCSNGKDTIELVHSQFSNEPGGEVSNTRICDNGNMYIVGSIIKTENGSFTSQLNVTLTSDIFGKKIECAYDNGTSIRTVGLLNLTIEFNTPLPPENISSMTNYPQSNTIAFIWKINVCAAVHYNILASNCGSCPTTTNYTTVTCSDVPTDGSTCEFSIQTVICGNITGKLSHHIFNIFPGSSKYGPALISAISLGVALVLCLTGLIIVLILLIKSKNKIGCVVKNTMLEKAPPRKASTTHSSHISIKKNIAYVVHSLKT